MSEKTILSVAPEKHQKQAKDYVRQALESMARGVFTPDWGSAHNSRILDIELPSGDSFIDNVDIPGRTLRKVELGQDLSEADIDELIN